MEHPVLTPSGIYYEKSALLKWLKKNQTDPMSREYLTEDMVEEDIEFEKKIKLYKNKVNNKISI